MKKRFLTLSLVFIAIFFSFSQTSWDAKTAKVTFKIKNGGITVDGKFTGLVAKVNFDAENYAKGSISATVKSTSISTGISSRDDHLKKTEYFNTDNYPKITLQSTSITKKKDGSFIGIFNLTIKSTTKVVYIPFVYIEDANKATFKGSFSINRLDYKIGTSSWTMSDIVNINLLLNAEK